MSILINKMSNDKFLYIYFLLQSGIIPLSFLPTSGILTCDINSGITSSSMVSFAGDTRLYYGISNVDDCAILQNDLNSIYEWASGNNMFLNSFAPGSTIWRSSV